MLVRQVLYMLRYCLSSQEIHFLMSSGKKKKTYRLQKYKSCRKAVETIISMLKFAAL